MKKYTLFVLSLVGAIITISSCKKDNSLDELRREEVRMLDEYISKYYPDEKPTSSGLYYIETGEGYGDSLIKAGDEVQIWYTGRTLADTTTIFDSSLDDEGHQYEPLKFVVGEGGVIQGLEEGVTYMHLGTKARLIIPSNLGYKAVAQGDIPRFSTLIFDIEIYKHRRLDAQ